MPGSTRPPRPFSVTLTALGVLSFAVFHFLRLQQALSKWQMLSSLLSFSPAYLAVTGAFWGMVGVIQAAGLWTGQSWARRAAVLMVIAYALYYAFDRLVFTHLVNPGEPFQSYNLPFCLAALALSGLIIYWIVSRPRAKEFFGEQHHEHQSKD